MSGSANDNTKDAMKDTSGKPADDQEMPTNEQGKGEAVAREVAGGKKDEITDRTGRYR